MRILEINKFNFAKGGADRHFLDVVKLLSDQGNDVAVFSMHHEKNESSAWEKYFLSTVGYTDGYSIWEKIKGLGRFFYSFEAKRKINKMLDDFQPELVHVHNIFHQISPIILFEIKKRKIPVVMTLHDYELISPDRENFDPKIGRSYWKFITSKKYSFFRKIILIAEKYFFSALNLDKYIDRYITPSNYAKEVFCSGGIKSDKIAVLPHFIQNFSVVDSDDKNIEPYAFCFGRIYKEKGIDDLVNIFKDCGIKLFLAGELERGYELEASGQVKYLGYLNREQVQKYIAGSIFTISASHLPETFGLVAMESIAMGKPFVAYNVGAYGEIIEDGKNGYLCKNLGEMKDVIEKIVKKEIVFNENDIRLQALEKYNSKKNADALLLIFNNIKL